VFPSYELLGWYACGYDVGETHVALHTQMSAYNESPIFLLINPNGVSPDAKELPVNVFISDYHGMYTSNQRATAQ
jgi:COP9 signalosome complex subunit 6